METKRAKYIQSRNEEKHVAEMDEQGVADISIKKKKTEGQGATQKEEE